MNLEESL
ncbi:Protein of unknown function [Bacillus cereus]|nr:Protein of unknown function [Bacillus cereus]SCC36280.1 Protein of unknown function [Bacillus wiedmannii]SCL94358.1 Protein of unknown function [Bacillus wiedmannii]SCN44176.1 Protein of unknown function [Bacillus wiedmannii]SCN44577.1 Protein of unknown function [Bacillus cereus]